MNLRKALDKAQQMREQGTPPPAAPAGPDRQGAPPAYDQSCCMLVQPDTLKENRCVCIEPEAAEVEAYKVLRTRIQQAVKAKGWNTLLITSPAPGDGKTLTAVNLALAFAKAYNQTVLLVDCDLKRQRIHRLLGLESAAGIVDFLVDGKPLKELIIWPGIEKLTLISGGRPIPNSAELLGSPRMKALVQELKARYEDRMVLFDSPPILSGADTVALAPCVDGILMVVRESRTRMGEVRKAIEMIPQDKILGFVLNHQRRNGQTYYY